MVTRKTLHLSEAQLRGPAPKSSHRGGPRRTRHISAKVGIESEQRQAMISEAAYFLSEHRGFRPGHELDDWLRAEKEIDRGLLAGEPVSACGDGSGNLVP